MVFSIHWGPNWSYDISPTERSFAQSLLDSGQVDVIHGHSSHHFKGIEIHHKKPILYGCGDFLNDYEGIDGFEAFRGDLVLLYLLTVSSLDRDLRTIEMVPYQIRNFRLNHVDHADAEWVLRQMAKQCQAFSGKVERYHRNRLSLIRRPP